MENISKAVNTNEFGRLCKTDLAVLWQ